MDDSTVRIPIGPQHPFLKEPAKFDFDIHGEEIVGARMNIGYNHRGIEKACEQRNYYQCIYLLERVCGICSHSHTTAFVQAVEEIMKLEVPRRGLYLRTLVCELERLHSHLLWLGVAAHEVGFDSMFMLVWRDRELVMDILEEMSGNRVNYAINTIGGVRRDITDAQHKNILKTLGILKQRLDYYVHIGTSEPSFVGRIKGVGKLPAKRAAEMCVVGPFARASAVDVDVRRDDPYAAYRELDFKVITYDSCDIYGRVIVRVGEIVESCKMIEQLLTNLPEGDIVAPKVSRKAPAGAAISRYEAPRGEDVHFVRANGTEVPERVRVRAPTMANLEAATESVIGSYVADIPIAIASIDPCFSCTDRMAIVLRDRKKGTRVTTWEELRRYGIDWYGKNKGIRF
ncbi:MAG TPA: nickel-dependent hydrogenase large subunit [Acidobacteriota bacterium]|nr:nickel-dependent hydrogenase large subunit [Acidobacteriota bacterium]